MMRCSVVGLLVLLVFPVFPAWAQAQRAPAPTVDSGKAKTSPSDSKGWSASPYPPTVQPLTWTDEFDSASGILLDMIEQLTREDPEWLKQYKEAEAKLSGRAKVALARAVALQKIAKSRKWIK